MVREMIELFGMEKATAIYRALPKGIPIEVDKKERSDLYHNLAAAVGHDLAGEFFGVYAGAALTLPHCHKIRLWARNEVIRRRTEDLYRAGWTVRLSAYLLGWEFATTAKSIHAINTMRAPEASSSITATTLHHFELQELIEMAGQVTPPVRIELDRIPLHLLPPTACTLIERLGCDDASTVINQVYGLNEEVAKVADSNSLRRLLAHRLGDLLAAKLLRAFAGELLTVPACHHARLWLVEQEIARIAQAQGGCLDEQTCQHLAVRFSKSFKTIKRIVGKLSSGHQALPSSVATWAGSE